MVILIASFAALICALIEISFDNTENGVKSIVKIIIRNLITVVVFTIALMRFGFKYEHFLDTSAYKTMDYFVVFITGIVLGILIQAIVSLVNGRLTFEKDDAKIKHPHLNRLLIVLSVLFTFLGAFAQAGTTWGKETFGEVTGDQLIINLTSPTEGTEASVYYSGFEGPVFYSVFALTVFCLILFSKFKLVFKAKTNKVTVLNNFFKKLICFLVSCVILVNGLYCGIKGFRLKEVFYSYVLKSDFIEENYVDPLKTKIDFPEEKRNLIYIFLESMENSYMSKDLGGYLSENIIPRLTELGYEGTVFSDTENYFGGPQLGTGTQWSLASMVNQTMGLPMKAPGMSNTYGTDGKFLPGAYSLGEILEKEGYEQTVMIGASAGFGGLEYLFSTHGNWKIMDYRYAKENNLIPEDYKVWWGFEDDKLYEFAKDEITRLYNTGKPFNFTMETADTHRPDGYLPDDAKTPYKSHYANALLNSSNDTYEFVRWIQSQPFYENTTIVLIGDHLSMDTNFFKDYNFSNTYKRTQFNLIINPAEGVASKDTNITNNRLWSNWDYFPTVIASIGGKIHGERLGIGTNLFSGKRTVYEEYGVSFVNNELQKGSTFYNSEFLEVKNLKDALKK